ncbi:lipase family protein [Nocardia mangyaensis]|uniref:lipase family protein n=1 Tax=Nocardia mangyaensis TaxID=2213200 RepID=UPI00267605CF|nr:lipase family protein [Nocardia mangyaensis]MDO3647818.1 lipase family protein [Nocardia mangyaensis]
MLSTESRSTTVATSTGTGADRRIRIPRCGQSRVRVTVRSSIARLAVMVAMAIVASVVVAPATRAEESILPAGSVVPDLDPFYRAPADIGSYRDGQLVASREFAARMPVAVRAWQLSYRTNDSHGNPILAVTTVMVPTAPWTGPGPRPAVSEQIPEDATGSRCAPSYGFATGTAQTGNQIAKMLGYGWAVAVPDFEGPESAFLAGPLSGHAVLDGVRAVGQFAPAGLGADTPWAMDGYSGGAAATGWAAELQPTYAPELRFVGAAMGGVPANLSAVMRNVDGGPFSGFLVGALVAGPREFPELRLDSMLNERGRADAAAAEDLCVLELLFRFPFWRLADATVGDQFREDSTLSQVLRYNSLGTVAPTIPIYNYHIDTDEVVPVAQADDLVAAWRKGGTAIIAARTPSGSHLLVGQSEAAAHQFLRERFTVGGPVLDIDLNRPVPLPR